MGILLHYIIGGFNHKNPDIQMQTVWLVGARGDAEHAPSIASMLTSPDSGIRADGIMGYRALIWRKIRTRVVCIKHLKH